LRVSVFSDIHGNCFALDAALEDMKGRSVDRMVCLGDTIQGGPQPKETVTRLRKMKVPIVVGNSDAWLLGEEQDTAEPTTEIQRDVRRWTLSKLSESDLAFIRTYRPTVEIKLGKGRLICFHGSPKSFDEVLRPDTPQDTWDRALGPYSPAVMAGGHTHTQQVRRIRDGMFFNPGSIGVAYNVLLPGDRPRLDPWAEYAILTNERGSSSVEFRRVHYDLDELLRIIRASGRPHADRLAADYTSR